MGQKTHAVQHIHNLLLSHFSSNLRKNAMLKSSQIIYCYFHSSLNKSILPRMVRSVSRSLIHLETELCKRLLSTSLIASPRNSRDEKGVSTWIPFRKVTSFISLASRHLFYSSFHTINISEETYFSGKRRNGKTSKQKTSSVFFWNLYFPG